jgi:hypothetical protein
MLGTACLAIWIAGGAASVAATPSASPDTGSGTPASRIGPTVSQCLATGQVWLVVQTDTGTVLRNECVGQPETGQAALESAGVALTTSGGGYLCSLAGYPSRCPTTYRGQYWQYWHASGVGSSWQYSQKGAAAFVPQPGSIEGWCYNGRDADVCRPPSLDGSEVPSARLDFPPATAATGGATVWIAGGLLVATAMAFLLGRRRAGGARRRWTRR